MLSTIQQNDFLTFLGYCLSPDSQTLPECSARICWADLLQFAKKQSVVGVYRQGVKRMSGLETNRPSEDDVMDWMGAYTKIVRQNVKTDDAVAKLTKIMRDNGIAFFVFKGQVIASYYPSPEIRTSGDVDKIMTIVLRYRNFGKYGRKEQQGGWKHSVETGVRAVRHITQFFWLSPAENLLWIPKLTIRSIING